MKSTSKLLDKYNVPGPRYTSYPTVPYWETTPTVEQWLSHLSTELNKSTAAGHGGALYLHLPFCAQLCTFCACNKIITKRRERVTPYIETLLKEWQLYKAGIGFEKYPLSELHLGGGTPTYFTPMELRETLEPILADCAVQQNAEFSFEADPRVTTREHLETLYELGFTRLSLGVQDYHPTVQKLINRVQSAEQVSELTETARALGYTSVNFDLVYGLPQQTLAGMTETITKVIEQSPDRIAFYAYAHVPWVGKTGQRGFDESDLPSGAAKRELYEQGRQQLAAAGYVEIGMDHFAKPDDALAIAAADGSLFRNFMGYIPHHVSPLIGLGVSAIGDAWTAFSQNEKDIEVYQQRVAADELPVWRGHILTEEDQIIRRHILNLMTNLKTDWGDANTYTPALDDLSARISEMAADNLVELETTSLSLNADGRPFLRNVCMALDVRLLRQKPQTKIFSQTI